MVGPQGCRHHVSDIPVVDVATSPVPIFILSSAYQACKLAHQWKPDLIIAGSGVAALPAKIAAKQAGYTFADFSAWSGYHLSQCGLPVWVCSCHSGI